MPVRIVAKTEGFRRCGVAHSRTPVEYPDGHWTPRQMTMLLNDPDLVVTVVEEDKSKAEAEAKAKVEMEAKAGKKRGGK